MQQPSSDALLEYVSSIDTAAEAKLLGARTNTRAYARARPCAHDYAHMSTRRRARARAFARAR
eukprot:4849665-Pleurochrysis_carterae.AAC.3